MPKLPFSFTRKIRYIEEKGTFYISIPKEESDIREEELKANKPYRITIEEI